MKNVNTSTNNPLFYGVFRRRGIRLVSVVDGSVHRPWMYSDMIAFSSPEAAAKLAAAIGGDAEVWALASGRGNSRVDLSPDVSLIREFAPLWAISFWPNAYDYE